MTKPCPENDCGRPKKPTKNRCVWHWLAKQPIEIQVREAKRRRQAYVLPVRSRVPERDWPAGERWCAGCQSFVPLFYVSGSRCRACESKANHASHVKRTYGLEAEEYEELLAWQGGKCYICRTVPRVRRLAVDHDHDTGEIRGLLCANDEWGCNVALRRLLNDAEAGRRLEEYATRSPLLRMRGGEPPKEAPLRRRESAVAASLREWASRQP